jgi:hypothetical protein
MLSRSDLTGIFKWDYKINEISPYIVKDSSNNFYRIDMESATFSNQDFIMIGLYYYSYKFPALARVIVDNGEILGMT